MTTHTTNKVIYESLNEAASARDRLNHIARAFDTVGNAALADELYEIAAGVHQMVANIRDAYGSDLSATLNESQRAVGETFRAILQAAERSPSPPDLVLKE